MPETSDTPARQDPTRQDPSQNNDLPARGDRSRSDLARSSLAGEGAVVTGASGPQAGPRVSGEAGPAAGAPPDDWHLTDRLHAEHGRGDPFAAAVRATRMPMIVCDPRLPDSPIVFANGAFLRTTGYTLEEVLGRNCRFLQGPDTDRAAVAEVRAAVHAGRDIHVELLNYKRDGTPFWNALYISPVVAGSGEIQFFFASQLDVTERKERELSISAQKDAFEAAVRERTSSLEEALAAKDALLHEVDHRVKNNMQTISALVAMEARGAREPGIRDAFGRLMRRVEAVATVHRRLYEENAVDRFDVAGFAEALVEMLSGGSACEMRVVPSTGSLLVPAASATPLALLLNEIVLETTRRLPAERAGARGGANTDADDDAVPPAARQLVLTIAHAPEGQADRFRIVAEEGPAGPPSLDGGDDAAPSDTASASRTLIGRLARQLRGSVTWSDLADGSTRAVVDLPIDPAARSAAVRDGGSA